VATLNKVYLLGNLAKDPETKSTNGGTNFVSLELAVDKGPNKGQDTNRASFFPVSVFGTQGDVCKKMLKKGSPVLVEGHLQVWEKEVSGQILKISYVVADKVEFLKTT